MKRSHALSCVVSLLAVSLTAAVGQLAAPGQFDLTWVTVDSGGGTSSGGTLSLSGTIGQPDGGLPMSGGVFELAGGFWAGVRPQCIGDVTGNSVVNIDDLLAVISAWGSCAGCPADINGNGVVNIDDLLAVITGWGTCP